MSKLKESKLIEHVSINSRSIDKNYPYKEIEYLDTGSITRGKIESLQRFKLADAPSRAKRVVINNDIVISMVRPIQRHYGYIINPKPNMVVSTGFIVLTAKESIDPYFLYSFLTQDEITEYLDVVAEGSTSAYPAFTPDVIEELAIFLPPLPEQHAIAGVLSSLDEKIDLLHRQNKTLEGMAEAFWRKIFVEEADPRWKKEKLEDICKIQNGFAFKSPDYRTEGRMIIRTLNFKNGFIDTSNVVFISIEEEVKYQKYLLNRGDFLLVMVGASLGNYSIVTKDILPALQNQNMWNFRAFKDIGQHYLNHALRETISDNIGNASGSAREFFQKGQFYKNEIVIPNKDILREFNMRTENNFCLIENNIMQIRTLSRLRDTLLPKLMSGEMRVRI